MVDDTGTGRKPGRPRAVTTAQIMRAATEIADADGLDRVSFRAVAARLEVSPMSVHRAFGGIEALHRALIEDLVGSVATTVHWPATWQGVLRTFAGELRALLLRHPLVLESHRHAALEAPGADDVAHRVVAALRSAGLDEESAAYAYATVHDFVTGHVAIRLGRGEFEFADLPSARREASVFARHHDPVRRFALGLDILVSGIEHLAATTPAPGNPDA
ncbi:MULTISPECIES: TetR/AcrR family transcriptional regulator [unclassified Streptomyces]|uniref:TetR/AcrR family transcriptional regulator n=1 Tax=unclassified Streptomyces TaxID=2593676 RepID=UPI0036EBA124